MSREQLKQDINAAFETGKYIPIAGRTVNLENPTECCGLAAPYLNAGNVVNVHPNDEENEIPDDLLVWVNERYDVSMSYIFGFVQGWDLGDDVINFTTPDSLTGYDDGNELGKKWRPS